MKCRCGTEFCWKCGGFYGHCKCGKEGIVGGHDVNKNLQLKPDELPEELKKMYEQLGLNNEAPKGAHDYNIDYLQEEQARI